MFVIMVDSHYLVDIIDRTKVRYSKFIYDARYYSTKRAAEKSVAKYSGRGVLPESAVVVEAKF